MVYLEIRCHGSELVLSAYDVSAQLTLFRRYDVDEFTDIPDLLGNLFDGSNALISAIHIVEVLVLTALGQWATPGYRTRLNIVIGA